MAFVAPKSMTQLSVSPIGLSWSVSKPPIWSLFGAREFWETCRWIERMAARLFRQMISKPQISCTDSARIFPYGFIDITRER